MKMIYRLHWDGWTRDIERESSNVAGSTYTIYLIPPTIEAYVAGELGAMISGPPRWTFSLKDHETLHDLEDGTIIAHYIADEPPWEAWNRYHKARG